MRVDMKIRRHWKTALALLLALALPLAFGAGIRIAPVVFQGSEATAVGNTEAAPTEPEAITTEPEAVPTEPEAVPTEPFDTAVVHSYRILAEQGLGDRMAAAYRLSGDKEYFRVDVVIDGTLVKDVGIRLKGNSTLRQIFGIAEAGGPPAGGPPDGTARPDRRPPRPAGGPPTEGPPTGGPQSGGEPRGIPYLIKFDAFKPGFRYGGLAEIALRVRGHTEEDAALLSELTTRDALAAEGLPVPRMAYASVSFGEEPTRLGLACEQIDGVYAEDRFPGAATVLYKSLPEGAFHYKGEDPSAYEADFEQKTGKRQDDLSPLIDFIEFVTASSDADFASGIAARLDLEAAASYLAVNDILVNMDSLGGNGNNYYLLYDKGKSRFTILAWDLNEGFGQFWFGEGRATELGTRYESGFPISHRLKDRLLALPSFLSLYRERYLEAFARIFTQGGATATIARWAALFEGANVGGKIMDGAAYAGSRDWAAAFLAERRAWLESRLAAGGP